MLLLFLGLRLFKVGLNGGGGRLEMTLYISSYRGGLPGLSASVDF